MDGSGNYSRKKYCRWETKQEKNSGKKEPKEIIIHEW